MSPDAPCPRCGRIIAYIITENEKKMSVDLPSVDFFEDPAGPDKAYLGDREGIFGYFLTGPADGSIRAWRSHVPKCREVMSRMPPKSGRAAPKPQMRKRGTMAEAKPKPKQSPEPKPKRPPTSWLSDLAREAEAAREYAEQGQLSLFPAPSVRLKDAYGEND